MEHLEDALRAELDEMARGRSGEESARSLQQPLARAGLLDEFFFRPDELVPSFPELGTGAGAPAPAPAEERREYLAFLLGAEEYAVDITSVREILRAPPITEVPRAPGHVLGVITVRGEVIAVFDPRRRLGLPPGAPGRSHRVVVCDAGDGPIGLLVDGVSSVVRLAPSAIEATPTGIGEAAGAHIRGIGRERDRLFILVDVESLLGLEQAAHEEASA